MDFRVGCSGWSYSGWLRNFYPAGTKPGDYLKLYSSVFNTVEIDSTFYRIPGKSMVEGWKNATPSDFLFTAKLPREITHERRFRDSKAILARFTESMRILGSKLALILIQLPPSMKREKNVDNLASFISMLPDDLRYAMEFRHYSWFTDDVLSMLSDNKVTFAWSEIRDLVPANFLTTGTIYLRLVGDRTIQESDFGNVMRDRSGIISEWAGEIMKRKEEVKHAFIFANNHFQGFGPFTVNLFRESLGLEKTDWTAKMQASVPDNQKTLF